MRHATSRAARSQIRSGSTAAIPIVLEPFHGRVRSRAVLAPTQPRILFCLPEPPRPEALLPVLPRHERAPRPTGPPHRPSVPAAPANRVPPRPSVPDGNRRKCVRQMGQPRRRAPPPTLSVDQRIASTQPESIDGAEQSQTETFLFPCVFSNLRLRYGKPV